MDAPATFSSLFQPSSNTLNWVNMHSQT